MISGQKIAVEIAHAYTLAVLTHAPIYFHRNDFF